MIEIEIKNLEKMYGGHLVFDDINFTVKSGEKIGFIGANGCGKTTLMRILAGEETADNGEIFRRKGLKCGYLAQMPSYPQDVTVKEVLMEAFGDIFPLKFQMASMEAEMSLEDSDTEKLLEAYGKVQERFTALGGYEVDEQLNRIIVGMSFSEVFLNRAFMSLSGGEKTKTMLGKMLLEAPDVMLLDEPTNHLDIKILEWLETYIKESTSAMIMISHDRYFLDHTIDKVVELERGKTVEFLGNYSTYMTHKEELRILQEAQFKQQEKKIGEMEEAIKRFRDWGTRADNEAMFKKAKAMEKRIERMDKVDKPTQNRQIQLNIEATGRSGKEVVVLKNAVVGYNTPLFKSEEFTLRFGDRLVLLGDNGTGKTTLFKVIQEQMSLLSGEIKRGASLKIGTLDQEIFFDSGDKNILTYYREETLLSEGDSRQRLAKYLFTGEAVFKKVSSLSGGEKVRLKLALLMEEEINMLLLDEPTNHIDIPSRETLEQALINFTGTILFVSHDRFFIEKVATKVAEVDKGQLITYAGPYAYYKEEKEKLSGQIGVKSEEKQVGDDQPMAVSGKQVSKDRQLQTQLKKLERQLEKIEDEISCVEETIETYKKDLENDTKDYVALREINEKLKAKEAEHDILSTQWLTLTESIEELRSEMA
jgi:ATPase subunit of ABC transporter with duplicated ATPase domains